MRRFWSVFLFIPVWGFLFSGDVVSQEDPAPPVYQSARDIPMEAFAQLPLIEDVSISPNGRYLAIIFPIGGEAKLTIFDLSPDDPAPARIVDTGEVEVNWIQWVNNNRLVLNYSIMVVIDKKTKVPQPRLLAFDRDGGNAIHILKPGAASRLNDERILSWLPDDPDHILMQFNSLWGTDLGVHKINVNTGKTTLVKKPENGDYYWYADHEGEIRLGWGYWKRHFSVFTKVKGERQWRRFRDHKLVREEEFDPLTFGPDGKTLFVQMGHETDTKAIYEFDLETATLGEMVYHNPDYDVDGVILSGKTGELLATIYTEDYPQLFYFDETYQRMRKNIEKALPGMRISILDSTPDERFHVVRSYSSSDPGMLYTYDNEEKKLSPIWEVMEGLDPNLMSEVKSVTYTARDGVEIPGYLTIPKESDGKNLPTVLLIHGGPWSRDDMVFDPEVQLMASRGYAVFQPNFRGSSGFGKEYEELGYGKWATTMQTDLLDAIDYLSSEGITDKDRVCIAGGSYGGYASLLAVGKFPEVYKCAFAFAPVTDVYYLMQKRRNSSSYDFYKEALTKGLKAGSYNKIAPITYVKNIQVPVLLIHGDDDKRVELKHSEKMAKALKKAKKDYEFVILEGAPHGIPEEKHRFIYFGKLEEFLAKNLGTGQPAADPD